MLFRWDNYNYNYNCNYKDDAVPMDVDSNALAHDHNYGKVSLSIELRKNAFFIGPESDHWLCLSVTHSLTD